MNITEVGLNANLSLNHQINYLYFIINFVTVLHCVVGSNPDDFTYMVVILETVDSVSAV